METKGLLKIEKRPMPCWLILCIVALPLFWGVIFGLLSLPAAVKYVADVACVTLLLFMFLQRSLRFEKRILPLAFLVIAFFLYCLISYLFNYQSVIYFLWGMRNNFRFYVFFLATAIFFRERDAEKFFAFLDVLFWINVPVTLVQYFALGFKQDYLGGIFGTEVGANGFTIIFFSIVLGRSILKYMSMQESTSLCFSKCAVALLIAALAELKFFFVFFLAIMLLSAFLTAFSWRKVLIFALGAAMLFFTSTLLMLLFEEFEGFMSLENIWEVATKESYSSDQTVNRLSSVRVLRGIFSMDAKTVTFGMGLGNCDTSAFPICNTPFYKIYGFLRYTYFSIAFLFLEVGIVGILLYLSFFIMCFVLISRRIKSGICNKTHGQTALITSVLAMVLMVYNASLRAEIGYLVYFVLALPFIRKGDADGYDPEEHALIDPDDALPN